MLPQTDEVIMKWLPFVGIVTILFLFVKRQRRAEEATDISKNSTTSEEQKNEE